MSEELVGQRIQIKRSNTAPSDMRGLFDGELGYIKDTNKLYIGQGVGSQPVQVNVTDNATTTTAGLMSAADKTKLNSATTKAFSNIQVGSTVIAADSNADTFTMVAGSNVTLTPDQTNDKVTIAATDTGATTVTVTGSGNAITTASYNASTRTITLDKGATYNNYSLPQAGSSLGGIKTGGVATVSGGQITAISKATSATTASKVSNSLTVGSKTYNGSAAVEIVASDLGLSNAMHFRGVVSSKPANTTGYVDGDVILVGNKEYVCSNSTWIELGDESSFKVKQTAVNSPSSTGNATAFIDTISQNANGAITVTKKTIPDATTSVKGIAKLHLAANCSTYTSDDGGATPAAVKKAVELFSLVHGGTADGNITIANSETLQSKQPILQWTTVGENTPRMGFAQDQSDGTFIICSLKGTDSYQNGLAIGGGSGNLFWKGVKVATVDEIPTDTGATTVTVTGSGNAITGASYNASTRTITLTKGATYNNYTYTLPAATSSTLGGVKIGNNITVSSGTISLTKANVTTALGYTPPTTNTTYSQVSANAAGLAPAYGTAAAGTIDSNSTDWVLTYNNGSLGWYKLPANAFKNDNTVYTHPAGSAASKTSGLYKFSTDATSHIKAVTAVTKADITALGIPAQDTTYAVMGAATSSAAGAAGLVPAPAAGKQSSYLRGDGTWATPTNTKNTAGSTNTSSKIFLIGATSQATNPQTYSHDTAFVGTDGCLYSNSTKVSLVGHTHTLTPSNTSIYQITGVGTMFTATVSGEVLTLTAGSVPTRSSVSVMTGVSIAASTT